MLQKKIGVFFSVPTNSGDGLCAVRNTRRVTEVHDASMRSRKEEFFDDGQAADTGIKYTNGKTGQKRY
jgi:hypothetical protein